MNRFGMPPNASGNFHNLVHWREAKDFPEELRCLFFGTTRGRTYRSFRDSRRRRAYLVRQGPWAKTRESFGY